MDESLADFAITALAKKGCDYAEARLSEAAANSFVMKNGVLQTTGFETSRGIGVRYRLRGATGFFSVDDFDKERTKKALQESLRITAPAKLTKKTRFANEKPYKKDYKVVQKKNLLNIPFEEKHKSMLDVEKQIKDLKIKVPGRYLSMADSVTEKLYTNTDGSRIRSVIPRIGAYYYLTIQEGSQTIQKYRQFGAAKGFEALDEWKMDTTAKDEIKSLHNNLINGKKLPQATQDVIICPEVVGIMVHESVGHPYEADRIIGREAAQAGESFVTKDMLNTRIGSDAVSVSDDPTLPNSYGFYLYDDEGVAAREKLLMKNGIINEFLQNRETASVFNVASNGSSRATNFDREPIVRMSNTYLKPGNYSDDELIKDIKDGVYIKSYMEWNIDDKRFSQKYVGSEAYKIENGKLTFPIKAPIIEITTPQLWSGVDAVAKNVEFFAGNCGKGEPMQAIPVFFGGPSMRLRKVLVK